MLRERVDYDCILEATRKKFFHLSNLRGHSRQHDRRARNVETISVPGCDEICEYLYGCVAETIRRDLRGELGFLAVFDRLLMVMNIVDMPDRRASLLIRLILQNRARSLRPNEKKSSRAYERGDLIDRVRNSSNL